MKYTSTINNVKCVEWDLTLSQAFLVKLLVFAAAWAKRETVDGIDYYWVSRNKVIEEIPNAFRTADSVYRALKALNDKGIIEYRKLGKKDIFRITNKGKEWIFTGAELGKKSELGKNSEKNPSKLGKKSEFNSEKNPTYKDTNTNKDTNDNDIGSEQKKPPKKSKVFVKPTLEEVREYFIEREHPNAEEVSERWFDHYTANGWKVGRNSMKDWKATVRNWIRNDKTVNQGNNNANNQSANQTASHFDQLRQELELKYGSYGYTDN